PSGLSAWSSDVCSFFLDAVGERGPVYGRDLRALILPGAATSGKQGPTIAPGHGPSLPNRIVNRSQSRPAIGSRTAGPLRRMSERTGRRSSRASTSVARLADPTSTPVPSAFHARLVTTPESGSAPVTAASSLR